jgi:hypothetical protein
MSRMSISVLVAAVIVGALFYIGSPPSEEGHQSAGPTPTLTDERLRKDQEAEAAATKDAELERRKHAKAVNFVRVYDRNDEKRGHVLEGTVTNSASFSVYNVQVCVEENCRSSFPSTLQPGAQGTFSVPLGPEQFSGSARVAWRLEPPGETRAKDLPTKADTPGR